MSTVTGGPPPWEWSENPPGDAPYTYQVPASLEVQPYTSTATYDGTGASGDFVPTLSLYSQSGGLLARVFPAVTVSQGDSATVTYLPPFGSAASSPAPSASGIKFDTTPQEGHWLTETFKGSDTPISGQGADSYGGAGVFSDWADTDDNQTLMLVSATASNPATGGVVALSAYAENDSASGTVSASAFTADAVCATAGSQVRSVIASAFGDTGSGRVVGFSTNLGGIVPHGKYAVGLETDACIVFLNAEPIANVPIPATQGACIYLVASGGHFQLIANVNGTDTVLAHD